MAARSPRRLVLLAAVALLVLALLVEGWLLLRPDVEPDPEPSAGGPVMLDAVASAAAVRAATGSTSEILSYGFEDLDVRLDQVAGRMTPEFAEAFRERVDAGEEALLDARTTQEVRVVDAGVVSATPDEVQALLFLDRYLARAGEGTSVRSYRALVTVVRSGGVWLVSDIRTL